MNETLNITKLDIETLQQMQARYTVKKLNTILCDMVPNDRCFVGVELFSLIQKLIDGLRTTPHKSFILQEFSNTLNKLDFLDTEDKEWICEELVKIMDILKLDNSNGLLNTWLYGFDPNHQDE